MTYLFPVWWSYHFHTSIFINKKKSAPDLGKGKSLETVEIYCIVWTTWNGIFNFFLHSHHQKVDCTFPCFNCSLSMSDKTILVSLFVCFSMLVGFFAQTKSKVFCEANQCVWPKTIYSPTSCYQKVLVCLSVPLGIVVPGETKSWSEVAANTIHKLSISPQQRKATTIIQN